ncbi:multiple sugar transport system permease protein [Bacillus sp. SORGH_AS 510]|uniref:carbohydrate ABC transporter permease n=1 Tax=Bacillus sp. SORGH_AS_0510 TaxID=3041771 RepID=UPI002785EF1D|nr:carbohydrate ABC transporter permease [Bacillus sp. SORGH_AS_0510]MDQ1146573.1 multiple sugar transport system permease protein [Bacillus sp. SORGH_AS_0510]
MKAFGELKFHLKKEGKFKNLVVYIILVLGSMVLLTPLWWMISTSLKSPQEILQYPPSFFPEHFRFSNYMEAWETGNFTRWSMNTLLIAVATTVGNVLVNSFVAYGFAKVGFKGRNALFVLVLSTMIIPGFVTLIPQYILFSKLGWVNTYLPLIVPAFLGSAFNIFLIRQFMMTVPNELSEAAIIDGASHFRIWWSIVMPLVKPALITVAIFSFTGAWNDLLTPLLYLSDEKLYTLQLGLQTFKGSVQTQWNYLMAMSVMVLIPIILIFFLFQSYFIKGSNLSAGLKE